MPKDTVCCAAPSQRRHAHKRDPLVGLIGFTTALVVALLNGPAPTHADDDKAVRRAAFEQYALTHAGDAKAGQKLYANEAVTKCSVCHKVDKQGGDVGPNLTSIGNKLDRPHLIDSLLYPSKEVNYSYQTTTVITDDGRTLSGIVKSRDESKLKLVGADAKTTTIPAETVVEEVVSKVSLMPDGLVDQLTPESFTDLVAYLETLSPGKKKMGAGVRGPIDVPEGFSVTTVATGFDGATALAIGPDNTILICEQPGTIRVVKNDKLLETPLITLPVAFYWERGIIGATFDPNFPTEPWVYINRVVEKPVVRHVVSRFRVTNNVADPASEQILLEGDDQSRVKANVPAGHQGGGIHFGPDGCLYIGVGEQTAKTPSQQMDSLLGKILRINRDGSIPSDNPFLDQTEGKYQSIWAIGCRNPFTMAIREDGHMLINDVGGNFEEVNVGRAGANYGWPKLDHGPVKQGSDIDGPIHWYPQSSINGGDFGPVDLGEWSNRYFFADFVHGWIHTINAEQGGKATSFAAGLRRPVDLRFAEDGSLYVLLRNAWVADDKFGGGTGSLLKIARSENRAVTRTSKPADPVQINSDATTAGNLPAYEIKTPSGTYHLEKTGAGLARMIDRDGNDWLGFDPTPGTGAGGEYRGFPNAVFQEQGNYFHASNAGTDPAATDVITQTPDHVAIEAGSTSGHWLGRYDFYADRATFSITEVPKGNSYWVLYEGIPGGQYDDDDWWMTSASDKKHPLTTKYEGDIPDPEWIAFGDADSPRSLVLYHHENDDAPDFFYQMEQKMTVFGFGRRDMEKHLNGTHHVSIGFVESTSYDDINAAVATWTK